MAITRQDLESDRLRASLGSTPVASSLLPVDVFEASLRNTLANRPVVPAMQGDVWIFGYGSLIWNPMVIHTERRLATLHGYHRGFYLYSRINRGTWDNPGLVLALDRGGSCQGMAFRIASELIETEFRLLWRREMMTGAYHPRWLRMRVAGYDEPQYALSFVMNRAHEAYAGRMPDSNVVACLTHACGLYGPARDYLQQTLLGLAASGVNDPYLGRLWRQLQETDAQAAAALRSQASAQTAVQPAALADPAADPAADATAQPPSSPASQAEAA